MKEIFIKPNATVKEAMESLDKTTDKVLMVVDDEQILTGTLTDGDVRRYILKGGDKIIQGYTKYIPDSFNTEVIIVILLIVVGIITISLIEKIANN